MYIYVDEFYNNLNKKKEKNIYFINYKYNL